MGAFDLNIFYTMQPYGKVLIFCLECPNCPTLGIKLDFASDSPGEKCHVETLLYLNGFQKCIGFDILH